MGEPDHKYAVAWRAYARRRNLALFLLFGAAPFAVAAFLFATYHLEQPLLRVLPILIWCGLTGAAIWWSGQFRCPRCLRRFGALGSGNGSFTLWRGLFDKACSNCKLRRWEGGR